MRNDIDLARGRAFLGERMDIFVLLGALIVVSRALRNLRSEVAHPH